MKKPTDQSNYLIELPAPEKLKDAPDIIVRDKDSGEVVRVLAMVEDFELCPEIKLKIRTKDRKGWEEEAIEIAKLDKKKKDDFLKVFQKMSEKNKKLTRKEISTLIEELTVSKRSPKYRQSGHLVDQKLNRKSEILVKELGVERKVEGIRLSVSESNLVHALNAILHSKSEHKNPNSENFYMGNCQPDIVQYGELKQKCARLRFKPSELYKAYTNNDDYTGAEITFINKTLLELANKKVLIKYDSKRKVIKNGKEEILTNRIEVMQSLISIVTFIPNLTDEEVKKLNKGDEKLKFERSVIEIALNPIFTDQIDTKFIEFPVDLNKRLMIAAGGHTKVTASTQALVEWLMRDLSAKRYKTEINEENLPNILGLEKYVKQNRKKIIKERIEQDVQTMISLGLVLKIEKQPNSTGGLKWVFYLNKDYD